MKELCLPDMMS